MEVKEMRTKARLTQKEFAKLIGCSYWTITKWEQGKRNCPKWVVNLIEYYLKKEGLLCVKG